MPKQQKLIAAIYASTLSPDDALDYVFHLDDLIFGAPEGSSDTSASVADPEFLNHVQQAAEIQGKMGRKQESVETARREIIEAIPNPCYLYDSTGTQIVANEHGRKKAGLVGKTLTQFVSDPDIERQIQTYLKDASKHQMLALPCINEALQSGATTLLVKKIAGASGDRTERGQFLISLVDFGFDDRITDEFRQTYDLTKAEASVAVMLAQGKKTQEIANQRQVSEQTVRTQIKNIKAKTTAPDIPALVRLLCGFSAGMLVPNTMLSDAPPGPDLPVEAFEHVVLSDGRRLFYLDQGDPNGIPVLHLHNNAYGAELPRQAVVEAKKKGLRIIAPYRAGGGDSDPVETKGADEFLNQIADDNHELLQKLGINTPLVVAGWAVGTPHALRFATRYPDDVLKLVGAARAPIWRDEWFSQMPRGQRFFMRTYRFLPKLLPIITTVAMYNFDKQQTAVFLRKAMKESPVDLHFLDDPEIIELFAKSVNYSFKQGIELFLKEMSVVMQDFTDEAIACPHKFHMLHGEQDGIVNISQTRAFVEEVEGTTLEVLQDAGNHIVYSHWREYLAAIDRCARGRQS